MDVPSKILSRPPRLVRADDPVLRQQAIPVFVPLDTQTRSFLWNLGRYAQDLKVWGRATAGLAAPQVGVPWRAFVTTTFDPVRTDRCVGFQVWINPVFSYKSLETEEGQERCQSIPDITAKVRRHNSVTIIATDIAGHRITKTETGHAARILQHEMDHLDGILISERGEMVWCEGRLVKKKETTHGNPNNQLPD